MVRKPAARSSTPKETSLVTPYAVRQIANVLEPEQLYAAIVVLVYVLGQKLGYEETEFNA